MLAQIIAGLSDRLVLRPVWIQLEDGWFSSKW